MKKWSEEETSFLLKSYSEHGIDYCAAFLNRTKMSVKKKAGRLNLIDKLFWSKEEEEFLINNSDKEWAWCADQLNRSVHAVEIKASKMKISKKPQKYWTEEEDSYLKEKWAKEDIFDMIKYLDRSFDSIATRAKILNIVRPRKLDGTGYLYVVYFSDLDLFKVGITNCIDRRVKQFGYPCKIVSLLSGGYEDVYLAEQKLLKAISPYKVNTGKLWCGNTETYRC
jgi:hypothetical protein